MSVRKLVNYYLPLWDFLYILQLEEYDVGRYLDQVRQRLFRRNFAHRDNLHYTGRMKLTFLITVVFFLLLVWAAVLQIVTTILIAFLLPVLTPLCIAVASSVISVPVTWQKRRRLRTAHRHFLQHYPDTTVIGVTGSFGKTTAKYLLQHVLQYDYRIAIIPDNLNTSLGIANHILSGKIPPKTQLLIVEMGAYERGDIAECVSVVSPDYAMITIYGDQHLERFGNRHNLILGKSEICTTDPKTVCYLSEQDMQAAADAQIAADNLVAVSVAAGEKTTAHLVTKLAQDLGVSDASIQTSLSSFTPPERRNNIIVRQGVTIIDNSYNISPMVAQTMLREAAQYATDQNKNLVVMTGGIGEQGDDGSTANQHFGTLLNKHASRVIINPSIYAADILKSLHIPHKEAAMGLHVSEQPAQWVDGKSEVLLWLTDHTDLAYL